LPRVSRSAVVRIAARVPGEPHRRREQVWKGDRGHREVGSRPQGQQRREETADAEAHHRRRSAGEEPDREDRDEEGEAIDVRFSRQTPEKPLYAKHTSYHPTITCE